MVLTGCRPPEDSEAAVKKSDKPMVIRRPALSDGVRMFDLIQASENLDKNSLYMYLLLCRDFSD